MITLELPPVEVEVPAPAVRIPDVAERAESELRRNSYVALKNVACEFRDGVLTLNGCLPTYYLKQVAQEAVARLDGIAKIENRIEVISPSQRMQYHV
jgi:osmotically-inducible protein OsmY